MKIKEVTQNDAEALYEAIDAENDTGVATNHLVRMVDSHKQNKWKTFESSADLFAYLDQLDSEDGSKKKAAE
jgi:hypothetical protein